MADDDIILSTRVEDGEAPPVPECIKRPCLGDSSHQVWVSPSSQQMLGRVRGVICAECMTEQLKDASGPA